MADWLVHLLIQIGGVGAVVVVTGLIVAKWLLKKLDTALNSYVTAFSNAQAAIDARIGNLERILEEQSRLTSAIETAKDEIAAQAKSRDNQWAFRKDVYQRLIVTVSDLIGNLLTNAKLQTMITSGPLTHDVADLLSEQKKANLEQLQITTREFINWSNLAPLATADYVNPLLIEAIGRINIDFNSPRFASDVDVAVDALNKLVQMLQVAGRKDLWDTPAQRYKSLAKQG